MVMFFGVLLFSLGAYNRATTLEEAQERQIKEIQPHWAAIPKCTVLITHCPPYQILDYAPACGSVGCNLLFQKVMEIKPKAHIFGHIHFSRGQKEFNDTKFYNVSICDENYKVAGPITEILI